MDNANKKPMIEEAEKRKIVVHQFRIVIESQMKCIEHWTVFVCVRLYF